jgi:hypothetical protein
MTDHLGYEPHAAEGRGSGNSRNGRYPKARPAPTDVRADGMLTLIKRHCVSGLGGRACGSSRPVMLMTTERCRSRSNMAAAAVVSAKMSPQDATPRLVVKMIEPRR